MMSKNQDLALFTEITDEEAKQINGGGTRKTMIGQTNIVGRTGGSAFCLWNCSVNKNTYIVTRRRK